MSAQIIGISGSPVKQSNTDRLVQRVLESSGLESEFVKLSSVQIRPCLACKRCVEDNICKVKDDFPALSEKIKQARAVVIGAYTPYGMIDAFTKSLLERFWSLRHVNSLNQDKIFVTAVSSLSEQTAAAVLQSIGVEMLMEKTNHVAQIYIDGNVPCLTCGRGDSCVNGGGIKMKYGPDATADTAHCTDVENQQAWNEATIIGELIGGYINGTVDALPRVSQNPPMFAST